MLLRTALSLLRSACLRASSSSPTWTSRQLPRRTFSGISSCGYEHELFNYTSGRWLVNEDVRLAERMRTFNVNELRRLAAQSAGRTSQDVDTIVKLDEGGFNRIFLITMQDGFRMVARIPYPVMVPKFYAVASEVATMRFLRAKGLPVPEVYDYSPTPDNAAETEYIFMEYVAGTKLTDIWMELEEAGIASIVRQMVELETQIMSIPFPAGGSLYYADDLQKAPRGTMGIPIPLDGERFCVGPDTRLPMWYGRRSQLDVDRGPYETPEAVLAAVAFKEAAYLERFGRPLLPFQRERREAYEYEEQSPLDHSKNLELYRRIAPLLVPKEAPSRAFCMRHPDLQPSNIVVSTSSDSSGSGSSRLKIVGLLDWQHTVILPLFLLAGIPGRLQNYDDPASQALTPPSLPEDMDKLGKSDYMKVYGLYHARLVHYHYAKNTMELNEPHHDALWDLVCIFIRRLFDRAGAPWEGETHDLKALLVEVTERWAELAGVDVPCPIEFDPHDVSKTKAFSERLQLSDENYAGCQAIIGFETETWVPNEHYERAKAFAELFKLTLLQKIPAADIRDKVQANWFFDDMNEDDYM
ncbi:protein kinase subdomain-containing protein PKL/CAK/Fmp29 [Cubamyces sp. BRFM 1775]|nr:protein kinase subdomain-containing protein PKL/CAK/Fmp29 [Cubamyces sp. BRFM 1775]